MAMLFDVKIMRKAVKSTDLMKKGTPHPPPLLGKIGNIGSEECDLAPATVHI